MTAAFADTLKRRMSEEMRKLSLRERMLIAAAAVSVAVLGVYQLASAVREKFRAQSDEIEQVKALRTEVLGNSENPRDSGMLARYLALRARKLAFEAQFKDTEFKEGVRPYLENLLRTKAGVSSRYEIKDAPIKKFGDEYELAPFTVKFFAVSMQGAVEFLRELVGGPHPLILTELSLRKGHVGDKLEVTAGVLSIRKVK